MAAKLSVGTHILGYLAALLPIEGQLQIINQSSAILPSGKDLHQYFYSDLLLPDTKHGALLFTFLVTILQNTEKEYEQLFIFNSLKEGVKFMPEAFCVIEGLFFPLAHEVLKKSENQQLLQAVHSIMETYYKFKQEKPNSKLNRDYLQEIGFPKLPDCATFEIEPEMNREITKLVILLLENMLSENQFKVNTLRSLKHLNVM